METSLKIAWEYSKPSLIFGPVELNISLAVLTRRVKHSKIKFVSARGHITGRVSKNDLIGRSQTWWVWPFFILNL